MRVLEKILEEIEKKKQALEYNLQFEVGQASINEIRNRVSGLKYAEEIIRSHMDDVTDTNNGWIPVEDGLPEEGEEVEVTIEEMTDSAGGMIYYTKTAWVQEERWVIKRNPYNPRVIAWRPLPKPYKPENRNNNTTKEYQQEVEHLLEEIKSENGYVRVSDLAKRFEEIDKELFKKSSWNLLQILSNINILIPKHFD